MIYKNPAPLKFTLIVLKTALYSAVVNVLLYIVLQNLGVIHSAIFMNGSPTNPITTIVLSSVLPTFFGGLAFWLLLHYLKKGVTYFSAAVFLLGLLSFAAPFSLPGIPIGMALALNLMHVVVMYNMLHYFRKAAREAGISNTK